MNASPVADAEREGNDLKSYWFLFWAYNVIWLAIAGFVLLSFLRVRRADRRIDGLEREIRK